MALPLGTTGSLSPAFASARLVGLAVKLPYAFTLVGAVADRAEGTLGRLRYNLGGDRPSQTAHQAMSLIRIHGLKVRIPVKQGWYFNDGSIEASAPTSKPPTYPTHTKPEPNAKLQ